VSYLWLKAAHVLVVIAFVGGMLAEAVLLRALSSPGRLTDEQRAAVRAVRRWDHTVTTPTMLLVWALGLTLVVRGGWSASGWLSLKLAFVVVLSGLHGWQSGRLRRLAGGAHPTQARAGRLSAPVIVALAAVIVGLVIVKPF